MVEVHQIMLKNTRDKWRKHAQERKLWLEIQFVVFI